MTLQMLVNTHRRRSIGSKQGAGSSERASAILSIGEYMGELASKVHFVMENTEEKKYWK